MPHFWCGVMKLRTISFSPFGFRPWTPLDGLQVDRRAVDAEALAERAHPQVILIELLAAGERAPGDQLVHVGVAGVVADLLALEPRPGRRRDDLARLRDDVAEADLLVLLDGSARWACSRPVVFDSACPGLDRDLAVGLRRQHQQHFGRVDVGVDAGHALGRALLGDDAVELPCRCSTSCSVFQAMPLMPLPTFSISGPSAVKRL